MLNMGTGLETSHQQQQDLHLPLKQQIKQLLLHLLTKHSYFVLKGSGRLQVVTIIIHYFVGDSFSPISGQEIRKSIFGVGNISFTFLNLSVHLDALQILLEMVNSKTGQALATISTFFAASNFHFASSMPKQIRSCGPQGS